MKKGQITVFLLIALLILIIIGLLIFEPRTTDLAEGATDTLTDSDEASIPSFVTGCLKKVGNEGLITIGLQGGYYKLPDDYFSMAYTDVPYYYNKDTSLVPSKQTIIHNLVAYIDDNIVSCFDDFNAFSHLGYNIQVLGEAETLITAGKDRLTVDLKLPITIAKDGMVIREENFRADFNVGFDDIYSIVTEIVTYTIGDPYRIYYSQLLSLMDQYDVQIDTLTKGDDTIVYVIQDPDSIVLDESYMFLFAVKIDTINNPPVLNVPDLTATLGDEFYYQVRAYDKEGDWLEFDTDSQFFGIHPYSGEINFTPMLVGVYNVQISVTDGIDTTAKTIKFTIKRQ